MSKELFKLMRTKIKLFRGSGLFTCKTNYCNLQTKTFDTDNVEQIRAFAQTERILREYENKDAIPWSDVKRLIVQTEPAIKGINSVIFNCCLSAKLANVGVSYYKHLKANGKKPSLTETYLLLRVFGSVPKKVLDHKDFLMEVYENIRPYLDCQPVLFEAAIQVFPHFDHLLHDFLNLKTKNPNLIESCNFAPLIACAFEHNWANLGWNELHTQPDCFSKKVIDVYMEYCMRKIDQNQFQHSMITDLVNFCAKHVTCIPDINFYEKIKELVAQLNLNATETHHWDAKECEISNEGHCNICKLYLAPAKMHALEVKNLKSSFLQDVIINNDINIKTSEKEINCFFEFLENVPKYDIVIDGLNMFPKKISTSFKKDFTIFEYLEDKNMRPLVIGKYPLLKKKEFQGPKKKFSLFITDSLSDDDVFLIYAALHGGPNTYFITKDFLRCYSQNITDKRLRKAFNKWQISHQYSLKEYENIILLPKKHALLPQVTSYKIHGDIHYHISTAEVGGVNYGKLVNWICLQGKPKLI